MIFTDDDTATISDFIVRRYLARRAELNAAFPAQPQAVVTIEGMLIEQEGRRFSVQVVVKDLGKTQ